MRSGAQVLLHSLVDAGVEVCFANPGTSEMHFVAALDAEPGMRAVLCLFEGVATGAADGYARVACKPAATLLHLGPGLANGLANLHNARRAHSPVVNIVGDHATHHQKFDTPLQSNIEALAAWLCGPVRRLTASDDIAATVADAVAAAADHPGRVTTLIVPADVSWSQAPTVPVGPPAPSPDPQPPTANLAEITEIIRTAGDSVTILIGGAATKASGVRAAQRISGKTGAKSFIETFPASLARGRTVPNIERLGYFAEQVSYQLSGTKHLVLVDTRSPVAFFAYPNRPSDLVPAGTIVHTLHPPPGMNAADALDQIAQIVAANDPKARTPERSILPKGALNSQNWAHIVGALLPENAIVSDESMTSGIFLPAATANSPSHDLLTLTGGAIGQGLPVAIGAAVAAPNRPVIALQADGSALYTISALWTIARESLDITTIILNNRAYAILSLELHRVGAADPGPRSRSMLQLDSPAIDFVSIAHGFGMKASRAATTEDLFAQFSEALREPGPHLIEAIVPH